MCFFVIGNLEKRKTERWNISTVGSISQWNAPSSLISGDKAQQTLPSLQTSSWSVIDMLRLVTKALLNNERTVLNHYKSFHFSFFSSGKVKNLTYLFGNINIISAEDCATSTDFEIRSNYFQYSDIFLSFLVFMLHP